MLLLALSVYHNSFDTARDLQKYSWKNREKSGVAVFMYHRAETTLCIAVLKPIRNPSVRALRSQQGILFSRGSENCIIRLYKISIFCIIYTTTKQTMFFVAEKFQTLIELSGFFCYTVRETMEVRYIYGSYQTIQGYAV